MPIRFTPQGLVAALLVVGALLFVGNRLTAPDTAPADAPISAPPAAGAQTRMGAFNPADIYQKRAPGVVSLHVVFGSQGIGGSGFVIDGDGHILTSAHVVYNLSTQSTADEVFVDFASGDRVSAKILGTDLFSDLAVLKVDPSAVRLRPVPLGDSSKVIIGEPVAAIGSPFGKQGSLSVGIVSAVHRSIQAKVSAYDIADAIQTDAQINRGNSGGPLFDSRGRVIGVNAQINTETGLSEGVGFAVPINTARRSAAQIIESGTVQYAYLGLRSTTVTPQLAREQKLPSPQGVLVSWLKPDGPAQAAGLSAGSRQVVSQGQLIPLGDQIVRIANVPVREADDVARIVGAMNVGDRVAIDFYRDGERKQAIAVLGERVL